MNLLLFGGTTEGRLLAERLRELPVTATICVATGHGGETLAGLSERFHVRTGRLDFEAMRDLLANTRYDRIVDATHPYAADVSRNIRRAAAAESVPYLRLLRPESPKGDCDYVDDADAAALALADTGGNVLLATGARDLEAYVRVPGFAERMHPRVLPLEESIRRCAELGFRRANIIAMQGPFGYELNLALMRRFDIEILVTKDGGAPGGFPDKMRAARDAGVRVVVVGRPPEPDGLSLEEVFAAVARGLEAKA